MREHFDPEKIQIIEVGGASAGCLRVERHQDHLDLDLIEIAPRYQNQGMGTKLIGDLIVEADGRGVPVRLSVLRTNDPARRLYEQLGFEIVQETDERIRMERSPTTDGGGAE
jgi:ribosomal protein S18 acetylase RimI-like enzyme